MRKIKASALKYNKNKDLAPKLIAKGDDFLAEKIIQLAKENNIPIKEDADLVEILNILEINEEIPSEIYSIVAEIFAFLYNVNKSYDQPKG